MARERLTDKRVALMKPPVTGRTEVFDTVRTGLCFRCTDKGAKSWSVMYRFDGELRRDTLGPYPRLSLAYARERAAEAAELVGRGIDPRVVRAASEAASAQRQADTVAAIAEQFITKHASQFRSGEVERILRREVIPVWGAKPMASVTRRDVIELVDELAERAPVLANRTLSRLKTFFAWAIDRDVIGVDPTARVRKPTVETTRERVLADDEIAALWRACLKIGWPFGPILQLLVLTAQRKSEIGDLRWDEINAGEEQLEIASDRYKTGRPHVVPLSAQALRIVRYLPKIGDRTEHVFTTTEQDPVSGYSRAKGNVDALMREELGNLQHWTIHDLRRTARTNFSKLGIPSDVGERILGHAIGGIRAIYDRHQFVPEMRRALDRWGAHVEGIVNPRRGKVTALKVQR